MSRDLSNEFRDAIESDLIAPALLVWLDIAEDPARVWTGIGRLWWAGYWWEGVGALGALEPMEETSDIRATVVRCSINQIPNHAISSVPGLTWKGRRAEVDLLLLNSEREVIARETFFRGRMDTLSLIRGPEFTSIEVSLVNDLVILKETWGSKYSMESHRRKYPGDTAFRFVPFIQDQKIHY